MIITIGGKAGSGKGTISKLLSKKLNYKHISIGKMRRDLAKKMGLSIYEFNKLGDNPKNAKEFDEKYEKMQKNLNPEDNIILDSRMGFYCQPSAFKIFLDVDDHEGAKRIFQDDRETDEYNSIEELIEIIKKRNKNDSQRYKKLYNVDHLDTNQYDLIIDTTNLTPKQITEKIIKKIENIQN